MKYDILYFIGLLLLVLGIAAMYWPASLIAGGAGLITYAVIGAMGEARLANMREVTT